MNKLTKARQLRRALTLLVESAAFSEEQALEVSSLYEEWQGGISYEIGKIVRFQENLYRVIQAHTSQENWLPSQASALYKTLRFEERIPIWVQPIGTTDAYQKGDKVKHQNKIWQSEVNHNVWEPGVYGWKEESEETK